MEIFFRAIVPLALAVVSAWCVDHFSVRRNLQAPGLLAGSDPSSTWRRMVFLLLFSFGLFLTVFQSIALLGVELETDLSNVSTSQLFFVHWILLAMLAAWYLLGFAGKTRTLAGLAKEWWRQFGLAVPGNRPREVLGGVCKEIFLGLGAGMVGWLVVLVVVTVVGMILTAFGGAAMLPQEVPPSIIWMASLSFPLRFAIATSAGVVEELFFRGFLQPRLGIWFSTVLFVLAHLAYGQPFLLLGVSLLSVGFALLARWRGNIWAAIAAHFTFDAVQLLILIPAALRVSGDL